MITDPTCTQYINSNFIGEAVYLDDWAFVMYIQEAKLIRKKRKFPYWEFTISNIALTIPHVHQDRIKFVDGRIQL